MNKIILPLDKQALIFTLSSQGKSGYQIIKETNLYKNTVYRYLKSGNSKTTREVSEPLGRKKKVNEKKRKEISEEIKKQEN